MNINIVYLILCHTDSKHIGRLARKLSETADVFIHVDARNDIAEFQSAVGKGHPNVYFLTERVHAYWGGFKAVEAMLNLLKTARNFSNYDRYVFLQGLDYPIKSAEYIQNFYLENRDVEFIRGVNTTVSDKYYFRDKCKTYYIYNSDLKIFRLWNVFIRFLAKYMRIDLRKGYVIDNNKRFDVFWGAAQFALTGKCVDYILDFSRTHKKFNRYFKHTYPADETYFVSIVMNSYFKDKVWMRKEDLPIEGLVNHRNLHYFEYDGGIKIFSIDDLNTLISCKELYCRKVTTVCSEELLDKIDGIYNEEKCT